MTTTTNTVTPVALERSDRSAARFGLAFLVGLAVVFLVGAAALFAFDRLYAGRVLPGVRVGAVDLSGLDGDAARARLLATYAGIADGAVVLSVDGGERLVRFGSIDRHVDVDAAVAAAMSVGRQGSALEQLVGNLQTAVRGVALQPAIAYDAAALEAAVERIAAGYDVTPTNAAVTLTESGFALSPAKDGRRADRGAALSAIQAMLGDVDAPSRMAVDLPLVEVAPATSTVEAIVARAAAERISADLALVEGDETWTIPAATLRPLVSFTTTVDGAYQAVVDTTPLTPVLDGIAKKVAIEPKNASFLVGDGNRVVGVTAGADGRALDVQTTAVRVTDALRARSGGDPTPEIAPALLATKPALSTEEAEKAAPLMERISTWTTYFPISIKNGNGANIWIPAEIIDGYVLGPGETFDFWKAVGPVTREKGYKDGGAIINGRTEPQGALAGGICSCSTTLFNAALRAGFEMGDRRNHYYYIDRYPLGLDATVFISASGSRQTMSFTNDTQYPVLIRGINTRKGSSGYVRFDLYSVPTGRTVSFGSPVVKNVKRATDSVQYTSGLAAGQRQRIEYPVDGKDVWVTRTVKDKTGAVIHQETYYSHYARITGVVLVGTRGAASDTQSEPVTPAPSTTPAPPPPSTPAP